MHQALATRSITHARTPGVFAPTAPPASTRADRDEALEILSALDRDWRRSFGRIVTLAQGAQRTRCCALAVLSDDTLSYRVCRGFSGADSTPQADIALGVLDAVGGIAIADAWRDSRIRDLDRVRDGSLRFYAGFPIRSPQGVPVAVLSVFDPVPRLAGARDLVILRRFASAAQQRLHALIRERCSPV